MIIANNELWVKTIDGTQAVMRSSTGGFWEQALTDTRLTDDGWTVFTFDGPLTAIGQSAFMYNDNIGEVVLPDGIIKIWDQAFFDCNQLHSINIPDTVREIGISVFYGCISLTEIDLPNSLTKINSSAFERSGLTRILIPPLVTEIYTEMLRDCKDLVEIVLPNTLTRIQSNAFRGCSSLVNLELPSSVTDLGGGMLRECTSLLSFSIPNGVEVIDASMFYDCTSLASVVIGTGVTRLDGDCFQNCSSLMTIRTYSSVVPSIEYDTFQNVKVGGTLYYPEGSDYSVWLNESNYHLGTYDWNGVPFTVGSDFSVDMPDEIEEETDEMFVITYPAGGNLNFITPEDVVITIDSETSNGDGTTTVVGTLRVNGNNVSPSVNVTITDGINTINKTINILNQEPPMATPTISINRYADLAFPAEGATKYITITYTNTQVSLINTPYSTAYGTTITPRTTTEIDNGVEIYYAVTVTANTYERTIPLIFSCSNAQGESTTETFTGMQAGESPNTGDAYINLDYTQHQFPASGGTFTVRATYSYPVSDTPLTVTVRNATVNTHITWCTATLVSTAVADDFTEAYDDWMITMNPGLDFTEPMSARITFSYTDNRGGTASAEFIATREAGTTTGTQSSLLLYRTQMNFTADGEFDFNDPVCTVAYKYTNEEDIEDPVVEGDWIVVTEGEHETRAGEILIRWNVAVARNVTTASRTGTITFRAIGQDDVEHEGVCIVIQAAADDVEETFEWVDFLWKDNAVTLDGTDITFRLLDGYDEIYTGRIQQRPDADTNFFFINKIVQDYVYMEEIPALLDGTSDYQLHENGYKTFRLDSPDTVGAMRSYKFKYDWSYTDTSSFILSESIIPYVVEGQKNLITYCNLDYYGAYTDLYTWIKADGNVVNGAITAEPEEYATKVVEMPENARNYVLSGQKYEVISPCQAKYVLYYLSPKGGWCWFPIMGKVEVSDRLTSFTLSGNYDNTTTQFGKKRYTVDIATDYNLSTGFLTESQSLRMWEMLESNMVYMHDMEKDVVFPVLMKQDTVEKKRYQRGQTKMLSYSFGVETSQGRMRI